MTRDVSRYLHWKCAALTEIDGGVSSIVICDTVVAVSTVLIKRQKMMLTSKLKGELFTLTRLVMLMTCVCCVLLSVGDDRVLADHKLSPSVGPLLNS